MSFALRAALSLPFALPLALAGAADAAPPNRAAGLRATLVSQGIETWVFPDDQGPVLVLDRQSPALPIVEGLVPVGDAGEVLVGFTFHRLHGSQEDEFSTSERSAWVLGAMLGYSHIVLADETTAVRIGGRIGSGTGGTSVSYEEDGFSDSEDDDYEGFALNVDAFTAGEVMFGRHFGLQGELGINYFDASYGEGQDSSTGWFTLYTALSAVLRF